MRTEATGMAASEISKGDAVCWVKVQAARGESERGTGRSTALMLAALSNAIECGKSEFVDHEDMLVSTAVRKARMIKRYVKLLGLDIMVKRDSNRVFLSNGYWARCAAIGKQQLTR